MLIAIPSKGRPRKLKSKEFMKSAVLFVPESEVKQYKQIYNEVVGVPNNVRGITPTRNWILKNTDERYVVMCDDDLKSAGYIHHLGSDFYKQRIKDESTILRICEQSFETLEGLGWKIFGIKPESKTVSQNNETPFLLRTFITANFIGIINDGSLYFDESYVVKEDYEIGLRHIEMFGGVLGLRYLYWEEEHWETDGGCKDYRTEQIELNAISKLIKRYPKYVRKAVKKGNVYDIRLNF